MHIRFTNHAQLRITERKVRMVDIGKTLKEGKGATSFSNTHTARKRFDERTLEVVYKKKGKNIIVITAYHL